jgi:predicted CoA-binding protein
VNVAVIGASRDRSKFGNKSLRAHAKQGFEVFPVNPNADEIEGYKAYPCVLDIPVDLDRVTVYLPPEKTLAILPNIAKKGTKELFLNPGAESDDVVARARELGLEPILACSIIDVGETPANF